MAIMNIFYMKKLILREDLNLDKSYLERTDTVFNYIDLSDFRAYAE